MRTLTIGKTEHNSDNEAGAFKAPAAHVPADVCVAVIIPTYKQPLLLEEALQCALEQNTTFPYAIVVVNDGCPLPETHRLASMYAQLYPHAVFYIHKRNGGLSAARNTGIEFALQSFPNLEAVYFLDSDNRLQPHALQAYYDTLKAAPAHVGWAYPSIQKFGIPAYCDTSGPYNPLEHLMRNVSEAGSMVHRRMLEAGVRFDEAMRLGYEDWEFWMQGLELGMRGVHVPASGFLYRYRPESMVSGSIRNHEKIMEYIYRKHAALFSPQALLQQEAELAPRYGIWITDQDEVLRYYGNGQAEEALSHEAFINRLLEESVSPHYGKNPGFMLMLNKDTWNFLKDAPVSLASVLWQLEILATDSLAATLSLRHLPDSDSRNMQMRMGLPRRQPLVAKEELPLEGVQAVMMTTRQLWRAYAQWNIPREGTQSSTCAFQAPNSHMHVGKLEIHTPHPQTPSGIDLKEHLIAMMTRWKMMGEQSHAMPLNGAQNDTHRTRGAVPCDYFNPAYQVPSCFPAAEIPQRNAFALIVAADKLEQLTALYPLIEACRGSGWMGHLFVVSHATQPVSLSTGHPFEQVHLLAPRLIYPDVTPRKQAVNSYFGAPEIARFTREQSWIMATMLAFPVVINLGTGAVDDVAGTLKSLV